MKSWNGTGMHKCMSISKWDQNMDYRITYWFEIMTRTYTRITESDWPIVIRMQSAALSAVVAEINGQCFGIVHDVQSCHPWVERSLYNVAPSEAQKGLISAVCVILISLDLRTILFSNRAQKRVHPRSIFFCTHSIHQHMWVKWVVGGVGWKKAYPMVLSICICCSITVCYCQYVDICFKNFKFARFPFSYLLFCVF